MGITVIDPRDTPEWRAKKRGELASFDPKAADLVDRTINKGEDHGLYRDVLQPDVASPVEILMQINFTFRHADGIRAYKIPSHHKNAIRTATREALPAGVIKEDSPLTLEFSKTGSYASAKRKLPAQWMDIHSHIQMEHVFGKIIKSCTDRIAAASHIIHDEHSTTSEFRSATASGIRWKRAMAAFTMLLHMLREMIEDAKHQPTGDLRLKKYDQVFNYLGYVLCLSRRTASHDPIAFGPLLSTYLTIL